MRVQRAPSPAERESGDGAVSPSLLTSCLQGLPGPPRTRGWAGGSCPLPCWDVRPSVFKGRSLTSLCSSGHFSTRNDVVTVAS